ncbi:MAG TPA: UDP-N-acetylmuramoyl-L-alanyl-D-glutamate--2,6-diaminopimelate ligase [Chitinophagales bacterium]|nr:UDP-N-acetylmuramoyl-L-alanyl-D-glutamate--2,6-diaminopimelate ligase [Chitinophagales bacterium]HRP40003.1 UDP-N-acetylmuramoyl-L-alanyl-D-glutamate--2,6-diaminopimelate ligase [Chitinophagales bacterium]
MKDLKTLLVNVKVKQLCGSSDAVVNALQLDSRKVKTGDCFVAVSGTLVDGHNFIEQCVSAGASVIVCEKLPVNINSNVTYVLVEESSRALGIMAANFYDNPSHKLKVVGVTGTNGKTSVATLLFRLFRELGYRVGLLSTVQNQIDEVVIPSTHTTPDAIGLNSLLAQMVQEGCQYCFMEASSHAIHQNRIAGLKFAGAAFTNITHDHLDYHKTFDNYIKAKKKFFDELNEDAFAISNADDRNGSVMLQNTKAKKYFYSLKTPSDFKAKIIDNNITGLQLDINGQELHVRLIGEFNAYNLLLVYAIANLLGAEKEEVLRIISALSPPAGRFEQVISPKGKIVGIVDYAHTPDALKNVIFTINAIRNGNEQFIAVVGCGGNRDAAKRPLMAMLASKFADKAIFTSDNPRTEDPNEILREMNEGVPAPERKKVITISDRKEAIRTACSLANANDIILIAGKGHEKYQEINGVKHDFDDKKILQETFEELEK